MPRAYPAYAVGPASLVTVMRTLRAMVDQSANAAQVLAAASQLGIERVQQVRVRGADLLLADQRSTCLRT
jgi:hypothetical protein